MEPRGNKLGAKAPSQAKVILNTGMIEIDVSHIKEESEVAQFVSSDTGQSVKKEVFEDDWEEVDGPQGNVLGPSVSAVIKNLNASVDNSDQSYVLDIKEEMSEADIYPDIIQRRDNSHRTYQLNFSVGSKAKSNNHILTRVVKNKIIKNEQGDLKPSIKESTQTEQRTFQLYPCVTCLKTFDTQRSLIVHQNRAHTRESLKCTQCRKKYRYRNYLMLHMHMAHRKPEQMHKCDYCQDVCKSEENLHDHIKKIHGHALKDLRHKEETPPKREEKPVVYLCNKCPDVTLNSKDALRKHVLDVHRLEDNNISNADSDQQLLLSTHYSRFYRSKSSVPPGTYICDYCNKAVLTRASLVIHIKKFHTVYHKCNECPLNFVNKQYLETHLSKVHGRSQEYEFFQSVFEYDQNFRRQASPPCTKTSQASSNQQSNRTAKISVINRITCDADSTKQNSAVAIKEEPTDVDLDIGPTVIERKNMPYPFSQVKVKHLNVETPPLKSEKIVKTEPDLPTAEDIVRVQH